MHCHYNVHVKSYIASQESVYCGYSLPILKVDYYTFHLTYILWLKFFTITGGGGRGAAMICNVSQAFQKSGALHPMPQLKAAPKENTVGASKPLSPWGRGDLMGQPDFFYMISLKMKFWAQKLFFLLNRAEFKLIISRMN